MSRLATSFGGVLALIRKEILALIKDPANRVILFAPAFIQAILFGYGATFDLTNVPYAVVDQSRSAASTELLARLDGSGVFRRKATLASNDDIADLINDGEVLLAISIPADFESRLSAGDVAPIQAILDGRNSSTALSAARQIGTIVSDYAVSRGARPPITIDRRAWYNPNLESRWTLMPALVATLSFMQTLLLAALSVAREREQGTFDQLLVTPLTPMQILVGKAIPSIMVGMVQSTIILVVIRFWFEIPVNGSYWLFYIGLLVFTGAGVGLGLSISALSLTMQEAMLYTFICIMPLVLLSGLITPIENMPEVLQVATYVNPLRFGIDFVRRVYLEGAGFTDIWFDFVPLLAMMAITVPHAAWLFRNRLT